MMEDSAASCVEGNFTQALEKAKEAVSKRASLYNCQIPDVDHVSDFNPKTLGHQ